MGMSLWNQEWASRAPCPTLLPRDCQPSQALASPELLGPILLRFTSRWVGPPGSRHTTIGELPPMLLWKPPMCPAVLGPGDRPQAKRESPTVSGLGFGGLLSNEECQVCLSGEVLAVG